MRVVRPSPPPRAPSRLAAVALAVATCAALTAFPTNALCDASADAREATTSSIHLMPVGFIPRFAYGIALDFHLGAEDSIEGFLEYGAYDVFGIFDRSERTRLGARWLRYVGNSFHVSLGAGYDAYVNERRRISLGGSGGASSNAEWKGQYSQLDLEATLGNRWQFDSGFSMGATWLGASKGLVRLGSSSTLRKTEGLTREQADEKEAEYDDDLARQARAFGLHFLKLYAGWAF